MTELSDTEKKFLRDLIIHAEKGSESWKNNLKEANIPLSRSLEETHSEFGPYQKDEERIIKSLFDKNIVKIKIKEREIHQSLDENERSKRKELVKAIGLKEDKMDELAEQLDID